MTATTTTTDPDMDALNAVLFMRKPGTEGHDPGLRSRFRSYLADPARAARELPVTDPRVAAISSPGMREVCLLAGAFRSVEHRRGNDIGTVLRQLQSAHKLSPSTAQGRLLALTRQPWPVASVSLRSIIANAEANRISLDWIDLAWAARRWGSHPHSDTVQRWARSFNATNQPADAGPSTPPPSDTTGDHS